MARTKKAPEAVKVSNASIQDYDLIIAPVITEKSMLLMQNENKVTFKVKPTANKVAIRHAVENIFGVKVESVSVTNVPSKETTRGGRYKGTISGYKKAVITLKDGEAIDLLKE